MKDILTAIKNRWVKELERTPSEEERLCNRKNSVYMTLGFVVLFTALIAGYAYIQAQPVSFEGDIIISGGIDGDPIITTLMNSSDHLEQFNITSGPSSVNGSIHLHGTYQMPLSAFMAMNSKFSEYYGV